MTGGYEEIREALARHGTSLKALQHQIDELKTIQEEIKAMNCALVTLTSEMKHTNAILAEQKQKINEIEDAPRMRLSQIKTAIISALSSAIIATVASYLMK